VQEGAAHSLHLHVHANFMIFIALGGLGGHSQTKQNSGSTAEASLVYTSQQPSLLCPPFFKRNSANPGKSLGAGLQQRGNNTEKAHAMRRNTEVYTEIVNRNQRRTWVQLGGLVIPPVTIPVTDVFVFKLSHTRSD
jgi:hypothetical protein